MSNLHIECKQEIIAGYKLPSGALGAAHFKPLELNTIPKDLFDLLRSQKGGLVERALAERILIPRSSEEAERLASGSMPFEYERTPAQAAAEVIARTSDQEKATEAAETALKAKEAKKR